MIIEQVEKILALDNRRYSDSKHDVSCDVKFGEGSGIVLKTYGRCHRQIFYKENDFPLENNGIQDKLKRLFLSNKKNSLMSVIDEHKTDSIFDCVLDGVGINIYNTFDSRISKTHIIETFYCLIKSCYTLEKAAILYVDHTNSLTEYEIGSVNMGEDTFPTVNGIVDESISLKNINNRRLILSHSLRSNSLPRVDYLHTYSSNVAKILVKIKLMSKMQYEKFLKEPFGDWECTICDYKNRCKDDINGTI
jgi:hypothetical protein